MCQVVFHLDYHLLLAAYFCLADCPDFIGLQAVKRTGPALKTGEPWHKKAGEPYNNSQATRLSSFRDPWFSVPALQRVWFFLNNSPPF
jgi:hypothetical protein